MSHRYLHRISLALGLFALAAFQAPAGELNQPRPGLHTGGQPTVEQLDALAAQGVRTVIDLRAPGEDRGYDEAAETRRRGLTYRQLPIAGKDDLTPANAAALKKLLRESGDGVLLHCASGNRVGALMALMAVQEEDATPQQAMELGRRAGLKSLEPVVQEQLGTAP